MWKGLKIEVQKRSLPVLQKYSKKSEKEYGTCNLYYKIFFLRFHKSDINLNYMYLRIYMCIEKIDFFFPQ